jgi:hypothetical protein
VLWVSCDPPVSGRRPHSIRPKSRDHVVAGGPPRSYWATLSVRPAFCAIACMPESSCGTDSTSSRIPRAGNVWHGPTLPPHGSLSRCPHCGSSSQIYGLLRNSGSGPRGKSSRTSGRMCEAQTLRARPVRASDQAGSHPSAGLAAFRAGALRALRWLGNRVGTR